MLSATISQVRFVMILEEDVTRWKEMRQTGEMSRKVNRRMGWTLNCHEWFLFPCLFVRWRKSGFSAVLRWPLTWLCMNLRLIPSRVTCRSPPSPVFMSWTGNSPPSSGPEGNISSLTSYNMSCISIYKTGITSLVLMKLPPIKYNSQNSEKSKNITSYVLNFI